MKKLFIKTYGCQMNFYDSDHMSNLLNGHGYETSEDIKEADLVILNTCHIRDKAAEKMYSDLGRIKKIYENNNLIKPIIAVAGCVAQAEGKEITKRSPWVDLVVGPQAYTDLPKLLKKIKEDSKKKEINLKFPEIPKFDLLNFDKKIGKVSDFVTIQEGCDKFCSFCVVPFTRGPEYSRPFTQILKEAKNLVKNGSKEITLLGQNVNAYNFQGLRLSDLILEIEKLSGIKRIRYTTSHPNDMTDDLIEVYKVSKKLMPLVHLPVQSGSDKILGLMNRKHNIKTYLDIFKKLKMINSNIEFSSDFIIAYPGESEQDFQDTLKLIEEIRFINSFSFIYSPRPGTVASELKTLDKIQSLFRLQTIQKALFKNQMEKNKSLENQIISVLVEGWNDDNTKLFGRSEHMTSVLFEGYDNLIGKVVKVKILRSNQNTLFGTAIDLNNQKVA